MSERGWVRAECPSCGTVIAKASALSCGVSEVDEAALCEFDCPSCRRSLLLPVEPSEITTLLLLGAHRAGSLPYELLEAHSGPPVSWDEVLEAHLQLERQVFPQAELARGRAA